MLCEIVVKKIERKWWMMCWKMMMIECADWMFENLNVWWMNVLPVLTENWCVCDDDVENDEWKDWLENVCCAEKIERADWNDEGMKVCVKWWVCVGSLENDGVWNVEKVMCGADDWTMSKLVNFEDGCCLMDEMRRSDVWTLEWKMRYTLIGAVAGTYTRAPSGLER